MGSTTNLNWWTPYFWTINSTTKELFIIQGTPQGPYLMETNSLPPEKRSLEVYFHFGFRPIFTGKLLVLGKVVPGPSHQTGSFWKMYVQKGAFLQKVGRDMF